MDTTKLIGVVVLSTLTAPLGGFIWVPILFFWWEYVKFCIKIDIIVIYLLIRMPIWLFIQAPLHVLKVGTGKIEAFFVAGYNMMLRSTKLTVFLLLLTGGFFTFMFAPGLAFGNPSLLSLGWWLQSLESLGMVVVGSVATTMILLSLKETFSGNIAQGEMPAPWAREELKSAPGDMASNAIEGARNAKDAAETARDTAERAKGVYNNISAEGAASESGELLSSDMGAVITDLAEDFGLLEEGAAAEAAGAGGAAAGIGAGTAGIGLGVIILVVLVALALFLLQLGVVILFFVGYIQFVAPLVLGPITAALGLGSEYGNWLGGEFADRFLAGMNIDFEDEIHTVMEARQRIFCLLEGPACLRQWQLNNTRTPDSKNVGETYRLQLDRFQVGSGEQVDVAYKNGDYRLPISFGLSNTRNGIYGINALNVSYRLRVIDFSRGDLLGGEMDPYCETVWRPIEGYNIRDPENPASVVVGGSKDSSSSVEEFARAKMQGTDVESGERLYYEGNDLYPGTSAATGFMRLDRITLENCGLLQPGAGETKTVLLEVKYDYFSEATLYFEAMARRTLQKNPDVQIEWKRSETADTPVKSVLNVNSPVLYDQDDLGTGEAAIPFDMRASLSAEGSEADYRVTHLEIVKSEQVEIADDARNCQFRRQGDLLVPTQDTKETLGIIGDKGVDWFSSANPPPFIGCSLKLKDPGQINPAGQTLSMDVRSNYTVKLNQRLERFRALNTRCNAINCPLLVTQQFAEDREEPANWKIRCTGPDSSDGCSVVQGDPDNWAEIEFMTGDGLLDSKLESGEYAYDPFAAGVVYNESGHMKDLKGNLSDYKEDVGAAIGLTQREIAMLRNRFLAKEGFAILSVPVVEGGVRETGVPEREAEVITLETAICRNKGPDNLLENYEWRTEQRDPFSAYDYEGHEAYLISFFPHDKKCESEQSSGS